MAKKIYVSPSDQTKNIYGAGNTNEAVQCRKIASALVSELKRCGFEAKTNLTAGMYARVMESNNWGANLHVCVHTNAYNKEVAGTRVMCYDLKGEGYKASKAVFDTLAPITPGKSENVSAHPELYECRATTAPCVYVEVDFHDVDEVALWIMEHTKEIAVAIAKGICNYYGVTYKATEGSNSEPDSYAKDAVEWAIRNGILKGDGTDYKLHSNITRQDMLVFLYRAVKK